MNKVSVILPCYNVEKYIERCLDSLCNQTLPDIEIICVDDVSSDNTVSSIQKFIAHDARIKLIQHSENRGVGAARNTGRDVAVGEYVVFIDPDDYVDNDFLEKLYTCARQDDLDVVKAGVKREDATTNEVIISELNTRIKENLINFSAEHWSAIYKLSFLKQNKIIYPEDVPTGQDAVFLLNVILSAPKITVIDDTFYHYVTNRPSSLDSKRLSHTKVLSRLKMLQYKSQMLATHKYTSTWEQRLFKRKHLLEHFMYTFEKDMDISDKRLMFNWLCDNTEFLTYELLASKYTEYELNAIHSKNFESFISPEYKRHLFFIERRPSGTRRIYFCGIKIYSYKSKHKYQQRKDTNNTKITVPCILSSDNNYAPYMYITMLSMLRNAKADTYYDFFLLIPSAFDTRNKYRILSLMRSYNCNINFIDMRDAFSDLKMRISHITAPTYYRLLAADILPNNIKKCIYLDVDVCVCQDLQELFNTDISDNYVAGVPAIAYYINNTNTCSRLNIPSAKNYVNAGVLVFNLDKIRKDNMVSVFTELSKRNFASQDQDVINVACYDKVKTLPLKYNLMTKYDWHNLKNKQTFDEIYGKENIKMAIESPVIIHYADKIKPWHSKRVLFSEYWWRITNKSVYRNKLLFAYIIHKLKF